MPTRFKEEIGMTESRRIEELKTRHAELEKALEAEANRPFPDQTALTDLKKQKLQAKDQIARLEQG